MRRREHMRARGLRGTRVLVEVVRDQVKELTGASGRLSIRVAALDKRVGAFDKEVSAFRKEVSEMRLDVGAFDTATQKLGASVTELAQGVDAASGTLADHERRLSKLERKKGGGK